MIEGSTLRKDPIVSFLKTPHSINLYLFNLQKDHFKEFWNFTSNYFIIKELVGFSYTNHLKGGV